MFSSDIPDSMTKEEFLAGFREAVEAVNDPSDEMHRIMPEAQQWAELLRPYDPVLATKMEGIGVAFKDLFDYIKSKSDKL